MRRFLPAVAALALALPARADEPKPATAAEINKQIADLQAAVAKKKAEQVKVVEAGRAIEAEGKKGLEAGLKKARAVIETGMKELAPAEKKLAEAKQKVDAARKAADTAAAAAKAAAEKLKAATDPTEAEELRKKVADLEAVLKAKVAEDREARGTAKTIEDKLMADVAVFRAEADRVARAAQAEYKPFAEKAYDALKTATKLQDEIDTAEIQIRKLKAKLEDLKP